METARKKRLWRCIALTALLAAIAAGYAVLAKMGFGFLICPIHTLTGFSCPGCGNTRAAAALMQLHFRESLHYNYAYPFEFLFLITVYVLSMKKYVQTGKIAYAPKHPILIYVFLVLLIIWGVVRNIIGV